jgi:CheY-like chemotaxis protein
VILIAPVVTAMKERHDGLPSPGQTVILLADDEPTIRRVARAVLEGDGYFVLEAEDGKEALLAARCYPGTIHLLLTDIRMPQLDGFQLRDCLGVERPATRVLLMSGQVDVPSCEPFLRKPFDAAGLKAIVRKVLAPHCSAGGAI